MPLSRAYVHYYFVIFSVISSAACKRAMTILLFYYHQYLSSDLLVVSSPTKGNIIIREYAGERVNARANNILYYLHCGRVLRSWNTIIIFIFYVDYSNY